MRAASAMPDMEAVCFRQLHEDLGDLPFEVDGLAGSFSKEDIELIASIGTPAVSLIDTDHPGISKVITDADRLAEQILTFTSERGVHQLACYGECEPEHLHVYSIFKAFRRRSGNAVRN